MRIVYFNHLYIITRFLQQQFVTTNFIITQNIEHNVMEHMYFHPLNSIHVSIPFIHCLEFSVVVFCCYLV